MKNLIIVNTLLLLITSMTACSTLDSMGVKGKVWCKERYLDKQDQLEKIYSPTEENFAQKGFIYSTLGAVALQNDNDPNPDFHFNLPGYIEQIDHVEKSSGFEVKSFIIKDKVTDKPLELVIAFTGSNQFAKDWLITNFGVSKEQYFDARNYVKTLMIREEIKAANLSKVVVTGYSLGGAIAGYVAKNPETSNYINEVWLFNPSPRLKTDNRDLDYRFWLGSTTKDALRLARGPNFLRIFPKEQRATDFFLVSSNSIYAHYRWVAARNMLWAADLKYFKDGYPNNPAMEIIQLGNFKVCKK